MEIFNKNVSVLGEFTLSPSNESGNILTINGSGIIRFRTPAEILDDLGFSSPMTTQGDIYVYGTEDTRLPVGNNGQLLSSDSTSPTGLAWQDDNSLGEAPNDGREWVRKNEGWVLNTGGASVGESNTASSQGTGTSIYYQKIGSDLQFYSLKSEDGILAISLNSATNDIEFTVDETAITINESQINDLGNYLSPGDNVSQLINNAGYITDYTVTESDVTNHEEAITITESQISDLQSYLLAGDNISLLNNDVGYITSFTNNYVDNLFFNSGSLTLTRLGLSDLSVNLDGRYLQSFTETDPIFTASQAFNITSGDIVNLANLSGVNTGDQTSIVGISGTKTQFNTALTNGNFLFVGDVADTNNYINGASFNVSTGDLTITRVGLSDIVENLDGRYLTLETDNQNLTWTNAGNLLSISGGNAVTITGFADSIHTHVISDITDFNDNSTNWDAAFGWGDHIGLYMPIDQQLAETFLINSGEFLTEYNSVTGQFSSSLVSYQDLDDVPNTFTPSAHTHVIADITDFTDNSANWNTAYSWGDHAGKYVSLTGDTMTGTLVLGGTSLFTNGNITLGGRATQSLAPTTDFHLSNKKYVDDSIVAAGGYTDENAQDAVGNIMSGTGATTVTYNDALNTIVINSNDTNTQLSDSDIAALGYIKTDTNTQLSTEEVQDIMGSTWINGNNTTVVYDDSNGTILINSIDTNTTYTNLSEFVNDVGFITSETDSQTLIWTNGTNNLAISGGNNVTITGFADTVHTHLISDVTDFTDNSLNWDTAFSWGNHSSAGYLTSVAFDDLTNKISGTGNYSTNGYLISGRGSGGVALTTNDGYGNANVTFNHLNGIPEQNGNSARIEVNTDATSDAHFSFELQSNVSVSTTTTLTQYLRVDANGIDVNGTVNANSFITDGGISSQFVKGDGTLDSNTYLTSFDITTQIDPKYLRADVSDVKTAGVLTFNNGVRLDFGTSNDVRIQYTDTNLVQNHIAGNYIIQDNGTTRFTFGRTTGNFTATNNIIANNKIGIGTTSLASVLNIYENSGNTGTTAGLTIEQDGSGDAVLQFLLTRTVRWQMGIDNSDGDKFKIDNGSTMSVGSNMELDTSGNVVWAGTSTSTNFILSSDRRLKKNIKTVDSSKNIKVDWKTFELKSEPGQKRYGVIAQELEVTNPEFVRTNECGLKSVAYIDLLIAKNVEAEVKVGFLEDRLAKLESKVQLILKNI